MIINTFKQFYKNDIKITKAFTEILEYLIRVAIIVPIAHGYIDVTEF
jgi:hypothetical protein